MTTALAKCHVCKALLEDNPDDRRDHIGDHKHTERRLDAIGRALKAADVLVQELRQEVADLRRDLDETTVLDPTDSGALVINTTTDDEDDDEPIDAHDDPDLADLNDITGPIDTVTPQNAEILAAETPYPAIDRYDEDDLDLRIARQTGATA